MFEQLGPPQVPSPPSGAVEQAMARGRALRRTRRVRMASGAAALTAVAVLGLTSSGQFIRRGSGDVVPADPTISRTELPPTPRPTPSSPPDRVGTTGSTGKTGSASARAGTPVGTAAGLYKPIPDDATTESGLDFGFLTRIEVNNGTVRLTLDRAIFYTGAAAIAHNHGKTPPDDYLLVNDNPKLRTFVLDPRASILAMDQLRTNHDSIGRQSLTLAQFISNAQQALTGGQPKIWLRHTNGLDGPVTAIAEQYTP